jgi:hypothetical protein
MSLPLVPDANHPAFPTRSQVDDWEIKRPAILDSAEEMAVIGQRCAQAKPSKELIPTSRIGADPFDTEHRLETSQGAGESRETNAQSKKGRTNARARGQKKELREPKEGPKKIKTRASAWRNKRNKNRKWRQYKDQSKREPKWKDIARS